MTTDFLLDELPSDASGVHMYILVSLWFEVGLSFPQFDTIYQVGALTESLDDSFVQSLTPCETDFWGQMPVIVNSMEFWEEVPAWHEVCLLKRNFDACEDSNRFSQSFEPLFKRNLIIVTQLLPSIARHRLKHDPPVRDDPTIARLDQEPTWYQEKFYAYCQRELEKEAKVLRANEISLRYIFTRQLKSITHFCSGPLLDYIEENVSSHVEFSQQEVSPETESVYPKEWLEVVNNWVLAQNETPYDEQRDSTFLNPNWTGNLDH